MQETMTVSKPANEAKKHILKGDYRTRQVWLDSELLSPMESQRVANHSPDGFSWGYGGSGAAQLALAILLKILGDKKWALREYQDFKWSFIASLPQSDFEVEFDLSKHLDAL